MLWDSTPGVKGGNDGRQQTNIMYAMCRAFGGVFLAGCVAKLFETTIVFVSPQILRYRSLCFYACFEVLFSPLKLTFFSFFL